MENLIQVRDWVLKQENTSHEFYPEVCALYFKMRKLSDSKHNHYSDESLTTHWHMLNHPQKLSLMRQMYTDSEVKEINNQLKVMIAEGKEADITQLGNFFDRFRKLIKTTPIPEGFDEEGNCEHDQQINKTIVENLTQIKAWIG